MRIESIEWSLGKSPEAIADIWSVSSTMEAVLLALAEDNRERLASILARGKKGPMPLNDDGTRKIPASKKNRGGVSK